MMTLYEMHDENRLFIEEYLIDAVNKKGWLGKEVRGFFFIITYDISEEDYIVEVFDKFLDMSVSKLDQSFLSNCISEHFFDCEPVYYRLRKNDPDLEIV